MKLLILLLTINIAIAQDIVPLKHNSKDGFWVSNQSMTTFRKINEERKLLEAKTLKLEQLGIAKEHRIVFYKEEADKAYKAYKWSETKSFWKSTVFFMLGVVATGIASYAAIRVSK